MSEGYTFGLDPVDDLFRTCKTMIANILITYLKKRIPGKLLVGYQLT